MWYNRIHQHPAFRHLIPDALSSPFREVLAQELVERDDAPFHRYSHIIEFLDQRHILGFRVLGDVRGSEFVEFEGVFFALVSAHVLVDEVVDEFKIASIRRASGSPNCKGEVKVDEPGENLD